MYERCRNRRCQPLANWCSQLGTKLVPTRYCFRQDVLIIYQSNNNIVIEMTPKIFEFISFIKFKFQIKTWYSPCTVRRAMVTVNHSVPCCQNQIMNFILQSNKKPVPVSFFALTEHVAATPRNLQRSLTHNLINSTIISRRADLVRGGSSQEEEGERGVRAGPNAGFNEVCIRILAIFFF